MNILIDATGITRQKTGVGVYAKNLLDVLTRIPGTSRFFILAQDDDSEMDFGDCPAVTMLWVPARLFRILPLRFLLEQIYLPCLLLTRGIDIVHSLHYEFPLICFRTRRVITFHDMTFFTMPEVHERLKIFYFRIFMRASVRLADHIIFVSRSAMEDYKAVLGVPRGSASVIPHGKGQAFRPDIPVAGISEVSARYGLPKRFILYIGTIEPRKNLLRLVDAFSAVAAHDPDVQLVIAGKMGWMIDDVFREIDKLGIASRIIFPGFIAEADKSALLAACTLFVYPSLYEGFGLPALEALACGAPTITSNTSALPEVVGDAALLVDPTSTDSIFAAISTLLSSPELRNELHCRGPKQAALFTWERAAAQTAAAYEGLMHATPSGVVRPK